MIAQAAQQIITQADGLSTAQVVAAATAILIAVVGALSLMFRLLVSQYNDRIENLKSRLATSEAEVKSLGDRLIDAHEAILSSATSALRDVARTIERCPGPADYEDD